MDKRTLLIKFVTFDVLAALIVWLLFMVFRKTVVDAQIFSNVKIFVPNYDFVSGFIFFPLSCLFVHSLSGFYRRPERQTTLLAVFTTFVSSLIVSIVIFFVLMLDDILTTGATAGECARILMTAGAKEVHCAAMAASRK